MGRKIYRKSYFGPPVIENYRSNLILNDELSDMRFNTIELPKRDRKETKTNDVVLHTTFMEEVC